MRLPAKTLRTSIVFALVLGSAFGLGCPAAEEVPQQEPEPQPALFTPPAEGYPTENVLVCTIYFYTGTNVGDRSLTTGPHLSSDGGKTWNHMAWESIITSAIDVCPYGKWVYCACGNGVLASSDGGRNWRLSGGWRMAEIQDIAIGPDSPLVVWAAGSYGLFLSEDGANTWTRPGDPQPFRYVGTVRPDRDNPDHLLIGTEDGLFVTEDRAATYRKSGPEAPVRAILQDSRDAAAWWVGTDGQGLWKSIDGGESWQAIHGAGEIINTVIQHPDDPRRILCGLDHGVAISQDDGSTWDTRTHGFGASSAVYALLVDSQLPDLVYAGARDGLYASDDGGEDWFQLINEDGGIVLQEAVIFDLWQGELYRGDEEPPSDEPGTLTVSTEQPIGDEFRDNYAQGFEERAEAATAMFADKGEEALTALEEGAHIDTFQAIAMIKQGRATEALRNDLRARFSDFGHSMFDSFPAISFYLYCQDEIPHDVKELIRNGLVGNRIYRGDTENHWLMYYTSLLLTAQTWPESSAREWYTGRTTQENYDDALGWINDWTRITTTIGQGEFDSPHYYSTYMAPCLLLYEFAHDPALKRQAGMVLDLLLADMGAESLYGRYCGGHSRMYDPTVVMGHHDPSTAYFYLYFGAIDMPDDFHSWALNGVFGSYRCPDVIANTALSRSQPYVHTEVKRVRNQMRYSNMLNSPVYKYTCMTPDFCLGSLQGGILQPIQQHTWDVTWIGSADNTTLFSLHPYYSAYELAMFFPEDPHMLTASVQAQKSTYTNPDKLNSSSPYERIFQIEDTLIAIYHIPDGTNHEHVTLYVPECLNHEVRDGWIVGADGNTYIAVYPCTEGDWMPEPNEDFPPAQRLRIPAGQTAIVVEVGSQRIDESFDKFVESILSLAPEFVESEDGPIVRYVNRHGNSLEYYWAEDRRVLDSEEWAFPADRLFNGPFIQAIVNDRVIRITDRETVRELDFKNLTIRMMSGDGER